MSFLLVTFMHLLFVWPLLSVAVPHSMEATPQARNKNTAKTWKKWMPPLQVPQIEMHCRMSTSQMTVKSHSNSPLLLSATPAVCNQVISPSLGLWQKRLYLSAPGNHCSMLNSVNTFHTDMSLPLCLCLTWVSWVLSLHGSWGSLVAHSVIFLLTDNYHQTLLTRPMKGAKAGEEFAIASLSDKYRGTLLFSLSWGWFTTTLNRIPVSSMPLHFSRVVCLRQFIIHSSFP